MPILSGYCGILVSQKKVLLQKLFHNVQNEVKTFEVDGLLKKVINKKPDNGLLLFANLRASYINANSLICNQI